MYKEKRSRPTIVRQVKDKKPQAPLRDDGNSQVINEVQGVNDPPAALRISGEDDYWIRREYNYSRLKAALGIDDDDFCEGIYQQLDNVLSIDDGTQNQKNFDFVLSVVRSPKPVDKLDAMHSIQMAVVQLSVMRQSEILLKPISYELPTDVAIALNRADWNAGRMEKQRIKIHDQPVRLMGERMVTRLMQTYAMQLQISASYRKAAESLAKPQQVSESTLGARALPSDGTEAARQKTQNDPPAYSSRRLNGSRQSAAGARSKAEASTLPVSCCRNNRRSAPKLGIRDMDDAAAIFKAAQRHSDRRCRDKQRNSTSLSAVNTPGFVSHTKCGIDFLAARSAGQLRIASFGAAASPVGRRSTAVIW